MSPADAHVKSAGGNRAGPVPESVAKKCPTVKRIEEIPSRFWREVKNKNDGTQYYTKVEIGAESVKFAQTVMLDGGSGVNSVPEDVLIKIMNDHGKV